jgi:hypothetical protein
MLHYFYLYYVPSKAAARLSQPILHWSGRFPGGYQLLGTLVRGDHAMLLRALCQCRQPATPQHLSEDPAIISSHKMNFDARSMMRWERTGRPLLGPTPADVDRIRHHLNTMVRQRYVLHISPGLYTVVHPSPRPSAL